MTSISAARTGAVVRKELTEFRRSPFIVSTMGIFPVVFLVLATVDIRIAQQLGILSSLPPVALTALMSFQVIQPTFTIAASLAGALLVIDGGAYLLVARLFDRERLVTGTRPTAAAPAPRGASWPRQLSCHGKGGYSTANMCGRS
jgi:hypothetical protein